MSQPPPDLAPQSLRVILVGNYPLDRQESMLRFADILLQSLKKRGFEASLISPQPFFGRFSKRASGVGKWLGYLDKFVLFPFFLKRAVKAEAKQGARVVVHICDHSNAVYAQCLPSVPVVITCHDLLAIRGALGEPTDCPATRTGQILQRWILNGLARGSMLVCDSTATKQDVERLVDNATQKTRLVLLGLNHPFAVLKPPVALDRLGSLIPQQEFLLHVGSNLRRKNREGVIRIFQKISQRWHGCLVLAGPPVSAELWKLAADLGVASRVMEVVQPADDLLEALYNRAFALLFPSRFEGFGWPIIEAQACGCPVVCSSAGPLPEVAGDGGLVRDVEDEEGFAEALLELTDPQQRQTWVQRGLTNLQRFTTERMIDEYIAVYRESLPND